MNFCEKSIFIWNDWVIGDPERVTQMLVDSGFEGAYLHSTNVGNWRTTSRVALVPALQAAGITVYASVAVYGDKTGYGWTATEEGHKAAAIVNEYGLAGCIFDVETGAYERSTNGAALIKEMLNAYAAMTDKPAAFCGWAQYDNAHPVDVLKAAMAHNAVAAGMPMAYWYNGELPEHAETTATRAFNQWRKYTVKPIIMAGRAYTDTFKLSNGISMTIHARPDAIAAFEAKSRELGAAGITWWDMEHAVKIEGVWDALAATPGFTEAQPPDEPGDETMWENCTLLAAFDKIGTYPEPKTIDFSALKEAGLHGVILRAGTSDDTFSPDWPQEALQDNPLYPTWFVQAKAAGLRTIMDYDHNPMLTLLDFEKSPVEMDHIKKLYATGKADAILITLERSVWKESVKTIDCSVPSLHTNYQRSIQRLHPEIWDQLHKVAGFRTGRWFTDKFYSSDKGNVIANVLDKFNAAPVGDDVWSGSNCPVVWARPKKTGVTVDGSLGDFMETLPLPTASEIDAFLSLGNTKQHAQEIAWIYHPAVKDANGNPALFRVIVWYNTPAKFDEFFNIATTPPPDTTPPAPVTNLTAVYQQPAVTLTWTASTSPDVVSYIVYRDGTQIGNPTACGFPDTGAAVGTHNYEVAAVDAAGNHSARALVTVTIGTPPSGEYATVEDLDALGARVYEMRQDIVEALTALAAKLGQGL